jgi:CMP-N,N'-diacetyllegionaminic acid synthase
MEKIKYLALIPARKGSKGIVNKNLKLLRGKPLIQYSFDSAMQSRRLNRIHVTTDSTDIMGLAKENGIEAPYVRPEYLASDKASMIDTVLYHTKWLKENREQDVENIILLQPTSPIRSNDLIDNCIEEYERSRSESLVAVTECLQHPYETFMFEQNGKIKFLVQDIPTRRQDYPVFYFISGSIYIASTRFLEEKRKFFDLNTKCFVTSREEGIDIDDMFSFKQAESFLE